MADEKMIKGIDNIFYFVSNMERSIDFYKNTLGLKLVYESEYWCGFDVNGTTLGIHQIEENREKEIDLSNIGGQVTFAVDNVHKAYEELKNKGVKFITKVMEDPWADLAKFIDPDGNVLNIRKAKNES